MNAVTVDAPTTAGAQDAAAPVKVIGTREALIWFWRHGGSHRRRLIGGFALKVVDAIFAAIPAVVLIVALEQLAIGNRPELPLILQWSAIILGSLLVRWVITYFANIGCWVASYEMMDDLRVRLLHHARSLPMGYLKQHMSGELMATLTQDVRMVELLPTMAIPALINAVVLPLAVTIALFFVNPLLAAVMIVTLPIALIAYAVIQRRMQQLAIVRQHAQADATGQIVEYVQGIAVIRAYGQSGSGLRRYQEAMARFREIDFTLVRRLSLWMALFSTILECGVVLMVLLGTWYFFAGTIDTATLLVFLVVSLRAYAPLHDLATFGEMSRIAEASLTRVIAFLDEPPLPEPASAAQPADFSVRFDNVSFAYTNEDEDEVPVLREVSFVAPPRSLTALVGPSGSGKTTITSLIARFWDVDQGSVAIGGVDVRQLPSETLNAAITMVFQDVYLFQDTILANIRFGRPHATMDEVIAAARRARCHEFISALPAGYETVVGEGGATLSGGERQRISIARAMLKDAPIVLLDEATASVDPSNERLIQAAIDELVKEKTLIIIAHRLSTIRDAQQILVLNEGRITERGTHDELIARDGIYARQWRERQQMRAWSLTNQPPVAIASP